MVRNFLKTASRFIASLCIVLFCLFVASNSFGDTGDVIDDFLYYSTACRGYVNAVWADVDKNGEYDTQVVFTTIDGHGYPTSEFTPPGKWYFFTYQACAGEPESRGRIAIHFVDILAPGFVVDDPATWTYKSIPALSIKASHDKHVRPGIPPENAYGSILAYRERFQNGLITGTETFFGLTWTQFYFSDPSGIMELYVTTDFAENNLDDLILYINVRNTPPGTDVEVDAGSGVTVTFDEVTGAGNTTATETTCSAVAPSGFEILPFDDPTCYDVETTATYSGTIEVCFAYDDTGVVDESNLKLFIHEDPPGEWVDITTSIDTVNNIICGETDHLSQFAVMVEDEATVPAKFDFNDGTNQGWTLQGAYDENGNGALSSNFIFGWKDYVNYPNPPGGDPSGDNNGSVQLFTMAGHGINNPGATWWIMQFHSPDLSSSITWQTAKGYSVQIAECMAVMTSLSANLYVKVYDIDQDKDRYFYSGTAQELQHDIYGDDIANWNHLTFDWSEISAFPTNYVVKEVFVNIWGKMSGYFEGGVYFDEVMPLLGTSSTPDLDGDGDADGLDLAAFASAFGSTSGDLNYNPGADFDNNGCVDESDLAVFATDFSRTGSGPVLYFTDAAENPGSVYKVDLSTEERRLFYSNPDHSWLSDVFVW